MTLSFSRITPLVMDFLAQFSALGRRRCLDLSSLNARDLADLNLPAELKGRLLASQEADRIRRGM